MQVLDHVTSPQQVNQEKSSSQIEPRYSHATVNTDSLAGGVHSLDQIEQALAEFDRDLPPVPSDEQVIMDLMRHADVLIAAGEARLASNILRNILMRVPQHGVALFKLGCCFHEMESHEQALKCFKAVAKSQANETIKGRAAMRVADTYYILEQDAVALKSYREALNHIFKFNDLERFEIYKNVGNIFVRAGDFDSAEEFYNKAYIINPNSDVLLVNFGTLELQRENNSLALERFRKAVELNSTNDRAWVGLAMIHRTMGDFELALANLERALDIKPDNRIALKLVIDWGFLDGDLSTALRRVEKYVATPKGSSDAEYCFYLAKLLTQSGRLNDARIEMERVLALDPSLDGADRLLRALDQELIRREATV